VKTDDDIGHIDENDAKHHSLDTASSPSIDDGLMEARMEMETVLSANKFFTYETKKIISSFDKIKEADIKDPFTDMLYLCLKNGIKLFKNCKKQNDENSISKASAEFVSHLEMMKCVAEMDIYKFHADKIDRNGPFGILYDHYDTVEHREEVQTRFKFEHIFDEDKTGKENHDHLERHYRTEERKHLQNK